ncbi:MAG: hypothetical protein M3O61_20535, partial [Gemmatimonadota bacterium]|nr:hypothetical protein [Gemmatimonadota bacterium]
MSISITVQLQENTESRLAGFGKRDCGERLSVCWQQATGVGEQATANGRQPTGTGSGNGALTLSSFKRTNKLSCSRNDIVSHFLERTGYQSARSASVPAPAKQPGEL